MQPDAYVTKQPSLSCCALTELKILENIVSMGIGVVITNIAHLILVRLPADKDDQEVLRWISI